MSYSYYPSYVKRADRPCKNGLTCEYHLNGCCAHYHDDKAKTECLWGPHCAWRKSTCQYNHDGRYIDKPKLHPNQCKHKDKECSLNTQGRCLKYHKNQCEIECYHGAFCRYMDVVTKTGYICPYYHREAWKIFRKRVEKVINPNYVDSDEEERKRNIQNNINIKMSQQRLHNQHYQNTFGHTDKTAPIPVNYTHVPAQQVYQHVNQPTQYIIHANTYTAAPIQYTGPQWILNQPKPSERIPLSYPPIQYAPASYPPPLKQLIQHSPPQHNTVKHASVQYAPVQYAPPQHTPVQHTPVQYTPGQRALVQYALSQRAPTQHAPVQNALIQHNTVQHLPVQHTPVQHFPVKHHTPIQYNTVEQKPIETNKIEQKAVEYEAKQDNTKTYNINENANDDEKEADESDQGPWSSEFYNEVMTAVERENAKT